jgi:myo-inositol-1(or 4)-monophosphatase
LSDLGLLVEAAREAGAIALDFARDGFESWDKAKGEPVTEADLAIDRLLRQRLLAARPDYGWLSEETADDKSRLERKRLFVVDPIDGTRAFIKGKPHFCVSLAVVEDERPIAACIFNPATDELFEAERGGGAKLNGQTIRVSDRRLMEGAKVIGPEGLFHHPSWSTPWPALEIANRNSIAYTIALVASGSFDASVTLSAKSDWDVAAADLIIAEAGGIATDHLGRAFRYNQPVTRHLNAISAGPALHDWLLEKLKEFKPPGKAA